MIRHIENPGIVKTVYSGICRHMQGHQYSAMFRHIEGHQGIFNHIQALLRHIEPLTNSELYAELWYI